MSSLAEDSHSVATGLHAQQATCWRPQVKNYTPMINSSYNGYRFDEVWLDR